MARDHEEPGRIAVRDSGGRSGEVVAELPDGMLVRLDDGRQVLLPSEALRLERDGSYSIGFELAPRGAGVDSDRTAPPLRDAVPLAAPAARESGTIPVLSEDLVVERRSRTTGGVRLHKHVTESVAEVDEPVVRERVVVEHLRIDRPLTDGSIPQAHEREDGVLVVPVLEEVLVVRKQLVLKEELHVRRIREETRERQSVPLRREHVDVERVDAQGRPVDPAPGDASRKH